MMKDQKGITLVALIITIIVMLILVGVSISVALNGGLFDKAREASTKTLQAELDEACTLAKAEVLMEYYEKGGNSAAESSALAKFDVTKYLGEDWDVSNQTAAFGDTGFTVSATNNENPFTSKVIIKRVASGN